MDALVGNFKFGKTFRYGFGTIERTVIGLGGRLHGINIAVILMNMGNEAGIQSAKFPGINDDGGQIQPVQAVRAALTAHAAGADLRVAGAPSKHVDPEDTALVGFQDPGGTLDPPHGHLSLGYLVALDLLV